MSKIKYEVIATVGIYKDKNGNEKKRYQKLGVVMQGEKGFSIKIECIPVGWDGWAYLSEPRDKEDKPEQKKSIKDMDDDIPW